MLWDNSNNVFRNTLGQAERSLASKPRGVRNQWAHNEQFANNAAERAIKTVVIGRENWLFAGPDEGAGRPPRSVPSP